MDENQQYLVECFKEEFREFLKGMGLLAGLVAAYWIFVG